MTAYTRDLIKAELQVIEGRLVPAVLDKSAESVLASCVAQIDRSQGGRHEWEFKIRLDDPILFRQTSVENKDAKFPMTVDVSGFFPAPAKGTPATRQSIVVRVWTADRNIWYREELDAASLVSHVSSSFRGRVVHRFHFDIASGSSEPWSHMHVGGRSRESNEYFRFPEELGLPRFHHHPMGLIQTCEFVLYHFFPAEYELVSRDPSWRHCLRRSEEAYTKTYVKHVALLTKQWSEKVSYLRHCCSAPCP